MNPTHYAQVNMTLRAGNNPNTVGLPVSLAGREHMPDHFFYVSKWEPDELEKGNYLSRINDIVFSSVDSEMTTTDKMALVNKIVEAMPSIYLSAMGAPTPVIIGTGNPFEEGWMKPLDAVAKALNEVNGKPEEN